MGYFYSQQIMSSTKRYMVGLITVNNVGATYDCPAKLDEFADRLHVLADLVVINTMPVTLLSAIVLKQMSKRNKGIIVNISSAASMFHVVMGAAYSASKVGLQ